MSNDIQKIQDIIAELEDVKEERIIAKTKLEQAMESLNALGCESIKDAEAKLKELTKKHTGQEAKLQKSFDEFIENYGELLD